MHSARPTVTKWNINKFLIQNVPSVLFAGIKPLRITSDDCAVTIYANRRNRNPNNSVYFANVLAAGEMAAGLMLFDDVLNANKVLPGLVAAITKVESTFRKPIDKYGALVVCADGQAISEAVKATDKRRLVRLTTSSYVVDHNSADGDPLAEINIQWALLRHRRTA